MVETDPRPLFPVVVTRHNWLRGQGAFGSKLLTDTGKMCCLGHVALACGATQDDIYDKVSPARLGHKLPPLMKKLMAGTPYQPSWNSAICTYMMDVNDNPDLTDAEREAQLITLGAKAGFAISFTDNIPAEEK